MYSSQCWGPQGVWGGEVGGLMPLNSTKFNLSLSIITLTTSMERFHLVFFIMWGCGP